RFSIYCVNNCLRCCEGTLLLKGSLFGDGPRYKGTERSPRQRWRRDGNQGIEHFTDMRVAGAWPGFNDALDDRQEFRRRIRREFTEWNVLAVLDTLQRVELRHTVKGSSARKRFIQSHTQGKKIAPCVAQAREGVLRSDIGGFSFDDAACSDLSCCDGLRNAEI